MASTPAPARAPLPNGHTWCSTCESYNDPRWPHSCHDAAALRAANAEDARRVDFIERTGHAVTLIRETANGVTTETWCIGKHTHDDVAKGRTWRECVAAAIAKEGATHG